MSISRSHLDERERERESNRLPEGTKKKLMSAGVEGAKSTAGCEVRSSALTDERREEQRRRSMNDKNTQHATFMNDTKHAYRHKNVFQRRKFQQIRLT